MVSFMPNTQSYLYNHMSFFNGRPEQPELCINKDTIADYVYNNSGDFLELVNKAGALTLLNTQQSRLTLFIPEKIDMDIRNMDAGEAKQIVNCAIIPRFVDSNILKSTPASYFNTRNPAMRMFVVNRGVDITLNCEANIVKPDIMCKNGIVHIIDKLLTPNSKHFVN
jgi:uncharacterized surface protein with fasciclin (FAS1) repeats